MTTATSAFPCEPGSIPASRRWLRSVLRAWPLPAEVAEDAVLLANELTTNAVLHAGSEYQVQASLDGALLRIEVSDHSAEEPLPRATPLEEPAGRGLAIVATVASRWGSQANGDGKSVWFELGDVAGGDVAGGDVAGDRDGQPESTIRR